MPVAIQGIDSTFLRFFGWAGAALWCSPAFCSWQNSHLNCLTCQGGKDTLLYLISLFSCQSDVTPWCLRMTDSCHEGEMVM